MSRFLNSFHKNLLPYTPGEQPVDMQYIKLNTNESPFPPSEKVINAINRCEISKLNLYSDPECTALVKRFSELYNVRPENILFGNGSDEILQYCFYAFCGADKKAVFADITYGFYSVFADLFHVPTDIIPLNHDFSIPLEKFMNVGGTVFIANPNAPTGLALSKSEIVDILESNKSDVVVIDEAYVDFGAESVVDLIDIYKNLVVVQTFSKARSYAGGRLGMCFADQELINDMKMIKYSLNPYNIDRLSIAAGIAAADDDSYYKNNAKIIIDNRNWLTAELKSLGFEVLPSCANFIFAQHLSYDGEKLYLQLKERGVLVRHFSNDRISNFNRITIGTKEQLIILADTIKAILNDQE